MSLLCRMEEGTKTTYRSFLATTVAGNILPPFLTYVVRNLGNKLLETYR